MNGYIRSCARGLSSAWAAPGESPKLRPDCTQACVAACGLACRPACGFPEPRADLRVALRGGFCDPHPLRLLRISSLADGDFGERNGTPSELSLLRFPQAATSCFLKVSTRRRNFSRRAKAEGWRRVLVFELVPEGATKPSKSIDSGPNTLKIKAFAGVPSAFPSKVRPWDRHRDRRGRRESPERAVRHGSRVL
jgi:hypothetical protein